MIDEKLGPAERIISALLHHTDHMVHNRPGIVTPSPGSTLGVKWAPVTHAVERGEVVVYRLQGKGRGSERVRAGVRGADMKVRVGNRVVGEYRPAGLYPEVAAWVYGQIAEVWKLDNELAARWASHAFTEDHRDLKVALCAFMLVQSRKGDPVLDEGKVAFHDEDHRDVGEAMCLLYRKDGKDLNPRLLLRVRDLLALEPIAAKNRELGFGKSGRKPFLGRWTKAVEKWLAYREENTKLLEGLVKARFRSSVMALARAVGYRPATPRFFEILRWKQKQADDGRRTIAIGEEVKAAETWASLGEAEICERIVEERPSYKRAASMVPSTIGITRAIMAATIEAGGLSAKDLVIMTPTLEELGLLKVREIRERWSKAVKATEDMRAANIATRVRGAATKAALESAADSAVAKAAAEVTKNLRVYFFVDVSGSMQSAIAAAKSHVAKFLGGFPLDRIHVATFNTAGRVVEVKHGSKAGVENAFRGIDAGGGTDYGAGVLALKGFKPKEDEDALFVFIGDEEAAPFEHAVTSSGLAPRAFGFVKVRENDQTAVRETAARLRLPCFMIDESTFSDPYAIPRVIRNLIAATPVGKPASGAAPARRDLVAVILGTELLKKPAWAR